MNAVNLGSEPSTPVDPKEAIIRRMVELFMELVASAPAPPPVNVSIHLDTAAIEKALDSGLKIRPRPG